MELLMTQKLVYELRKVLANTFVMYYKAHVAHWNVEGMSFDSLHKFFGELYGDLHGAVDPIAEHLRGLGVYAPVSLSGLMSECEVPEDTGVLDAPDMIVGLVAANDLVRASLYRAHIEADEAKEYGVVNYLEARIDMHDKWAWQLRSHLK